jgi:translation elongation factor P/translation initiation factor 5A
MDLESYETFDLKIPEELKAKVKEGINVLYWNVLEDKILQQIAGD